MGKKLSHRTLASVTQEFETTELAPVPENLALDDLAHALRERIKELECLYAISKLRELDIHDANNFLQGVVDCLPRTWQYPAFASARITYEKMIHVSEGFHEGPWQMKAELHEHGKVLGAITVFYGKGIPVSPGGPFLPEEHSLLCSIAERIVTSLAHMRTEEELIDAHRSLRSQHQLLQERNITLRTVLSSLEEEKCEVRSAILTNIQKVIMPIVFELEIAVTGRQRSYVTLLRQSLQEIASPFLTSLSRDHVELTPVEVAISAMIRNGLSTKDIANLRCITPATVRRHRENIRKKLGLTNRQVNLVTYLQNSTGNEPGAGRERPERGQDLASSSVVGVDEDA